LKYFFLAISLIIISFSEINAQDFKLDNPLSIAPSLSGNYGELRSNHFHAGIDLKTGGREGLEVMAVDSGYVSRIKISSYGYGKVIYVDHPNGYTTVYAHLSKLSDSVNSYAKRVQYEQESFEIDVYPGKYDLPVSKGQVIALSGNTGGSGGPHLHFEIRETESEIPRNPLLFGFPLGDSKYPQIEAVSIEPLGTESKVNGLSKTFRTRTQGNANKTLASGSTIKISGPFGIGIRGYDEQNGSNNHNGIYKIQCFVDGQLKGTFVADSIAFDKSRYLNALIDYKHYYNYRSRFLRLHRIPGNLLENINYLEDGILDLSEGLHEIKITATDVEGNTCNVSFKALVTSPKPVKDAIQQELVPFNVDYFHESEFARITLSAGSTYEDLPLHYKEIESTNEPSATIEFMKADQPLQKRFSIQIKPSDSIVGQDHWLIAQVNSAGKVSRALSSSWNDGFLRAESKSFGRFKIVRDTRKPSIKSGNFYSGRTYNTGELRFEIDDSFSGVYSYKVLVDGKYVLAEYEYKQDLLKIDVTELPKSEEAQQLEIIVSDLAGNVATFEGSFYHR
jgi:murein DD-endopeptidase MepM/ murein hydrolase activator NlpD